MSDETEDPKSDTNASLAPPAPPVIDGMAESVKQCFERGNEIRKAKREINNYIASIVEDLILGFPGHEDAIRKGLEGASAKLLARRDKGKRDEREQKQRDEQEKKRNSNGQSADRGANGVSGKLSGDVRSDAEGGAEDSRGETKFG